MTAESVKMWRCPACNRLLVERSLDYARSRHARMVAARCGSRDADFVREATWPAYLASLRRCRCGSRKRLRSVPAGAIRGTQLDLQIEPVVIQGTLQ